jgi:hypothetical protein
MQAELLKLSIFPPNKRCGKQTVNRSETRTMLILDLYAQFPIFPQENNFS